MTVTSITATETPEEQLTSLNAARDALRENLHEVQTHLEDERAERTRSTVAGLDRGVILEHRHRIADLLAEAEEIGDALHVVEQQVSEVAEVVEQRRLEHLIEEAATLRKVFAEAGAKLQPAVERFAKEEYRPLLEAVHAARHAAVEAEREARQAQGMHREDVHAAGAAVGHFTCGNPALDQALSLLAFPPVANPNLPEAVAARGGTIWTGESEETGVHGVTDDPRGDYAPV